MFGSARKNKQKAQPLTKETANPNAATAAASAFMRREPSTSLSSAAAAAALKARPTTPTIVSETQSRRSLRRSPSVSSTASRGRDRHREVRELYRSPSTGSMTERTFRSPSPGRGPIPQPYDVPPVPSLPKNAQSTSQLRPTSSHSKSGATTLQTQPFRTASQKQKESQNGAWFGGAVAREGASARTADSVLSSTAHDNDERSGSVSPSINFSYPRAREMESASNSSATEPAMVYDANSRRMVPNLELVRRTQSVRDAAEKPVKKRKAEVTRSGSHLSKGTVGRTKVAPTESFEQAKQPARSTPRPAPDEPEPESEPEPEPDRALAASIPGVQLDVNDTSAARQTHMPSEKMERDVTEHSALVSSSSRQAEQSPPASSKRSARDSGHGETGESHNSVDAAPVPSTDSVSDAANGKAVQPRPEPAEQKPHPEETSEATSSSALHSHPRDSVRRARMHSESPARSPGRSAHFATTNDRLLVRHEPPPRSLSPRKSALKHSSSARGASPSDDSSEASGPVSALSTKDEQARKKSVRVSFNDESNVVVGEAAEPTPMDSPVVLSPQVKKSWHNILGRNRKDTATEREDDDEETMAPRPALPLFGSVREKKTREPDNERPLVRPSERSMSPPESSTVAEQSTAHTLDASSDAGVGSVLALESASKNEANISRTREPLPPVVTSIEGSGYESSLLMTTDDEMDDSHVTNDFREADPISEETPTERVDSDAHLDNNVAKQAPVVSHQIDSSAAPKQSNGSAISSSEVASTDPARTETTVIPSISVVHPTSPATKHPSPTSPEHEFFDVPGGFPDEEESPVERQSPSTTAGATPGLAHISTATAVESAAPVTPTRTEPTISLPPMADIQEEDEASDGDSIYSDAYEDMSDAENGGFMSLNAVLTAPADSKVSKLYEKTKRKSQEANPSLFATSTGEPDETGGVGETHDDWENAKAYWRSLTYEKRRQLEIEALEEAGEDADQEAESKRKKKAKKRKSVDRPAVDRVESASRNSRSPDRTYQIQPGTSWAYEESSTAKPASAEPRSEPAVAPAPKFRKSMRGEQPPARAEARPAPQAATGMRKSMRSNAGADSGNAVATTATASSTARPVSYHPATAKEAAKRTQRAQSSDGRPSSTAGASSSGMKSTLRRRGSDSSESSFKRARPVSQGFAFRSSMRAGAPAPPPEPESPVSATKGSGRFSLRSLSPTGSTFRRSSFTSPSSPTQAGQSRMRQSMRNSQSNAKEKKRMSAFGRLTGKKETKGPGGSRFADSSDEEDGGGGRPFFSSRFADSSDDESAPAAAAPSGGFAKSMRSSKGANTAAAAALGVVPARQQRSDSPDLPDSDDDEIIQPKRNAVTNGASARAGGGLQRSRSGRGTLASPTSPGQLDVDGVGERPAHKRRGSFMSSILRRKKDDGGRISRDVGESAARRDTRLERSSDQLHVIRTNSGNVHKLHKRDISWPLPDTSAEGAPPAPTNGLPQRPATSAGPGSAPPRGFLKRRNTGNQATSGISSTTAAEPATTQNVPTETYKAKKFGKLRKMFGLND